MKVKIILLLSIFFIFLSSCSKCRECKKEEWVVKKIEVELITGTKKIVYFKIPPYSDVTISSTNGSYRMSAWVYDAICIKNEITLMYGVVYCKVLN
jgi:hypothetical protein